MLNDSQVKAAKPTDKDYKMPDGLGLYLIVKKNGTKAWRYNYRFFNKQKTMSYGTYPNLSVKEARRLHREAKELLEKHVDPSEIKKQKKNQRFQNVENSFGAVAERWAEEKINVWAEGTAKRQLAILNKDVLPYLESRPISEVETHELASCLRRIMEEML